VSAPREERTPEFVRWTIARPCPLREEYRWTDPEQTERLLRPVRGASEALSEERVHREVVFQSAPPIHGELEQVRGFLLDEALSVFGGMDRVRATCGECPANALHKGKDLWAGCYGMFYLAEADRFHRGIEDSAQRIGASATVRGAFHNTSPLWYGFWIDAPIEEEQAHLLLAILTPVAEEAPSAALFLDEFLAGLRASLEAGLPMYAGFIPAGRLQDGAWKLDPHCKRCGAPRSLGGGACRVCGVRGEECAGRTRKIRGERPYAPLIRQLGATRLATLVEEYNARGVRNRESL
jgi:hypothetical protein